MLGVIGGSLLFAYAYAGIELSPQIVALAMSLPIALLVAGPPRYPETGNIPVWWYVLAGAVGLSVVTETIAVLPGPTDAFQWITGAEGATLFGSSGSGSVALALAATAVLAVDLASHWPFLRTKPAVYGPFSPLQRNSAVLVTLSFGLVAVHAAQTTGVDGSMHTRLFAFAVGYAAAMSVCLAFVRFIETSTIRMSSSVRMGTADFTILVVMIAVCYFAIVFGQQQLKENPPADYSALKPVTDAVGPYVAQAVEWITYGLSFLQPLWNLVPAKSQIGALIAPYSPARMLANKGASVDEPLVAAVLATLIFGAASALRHSANRVHRMLAPMFAEVSTHGSVHTDCAALTIEGIDEATLARVLSTLADKGARATFFVSAGDARAVPQLVRLVAAAGHEIGLLGPSGTSSGRLDTEGAMREAKETLERALQTVPGEFEDVDEAEMEMEAMEQQAEEEEEKPKARRRAGSRARGPGGKKGSDEDEDGDDGDDDDDVDVSFAALLYSTLHFRLELVPEPFRQTTVRWFRPQSGTRNVSILRAANAAGMSVCLWSHCPWDHDTKGPARVRERLSHQGDLRGGIVKLHAQLPADLVFSLSHVPGFERPSYDHDVVASVDRALDVICGSRGLAGVTVSELCPDGGRGLEVL